MRTKVHILILLVAYFSQIEAATPDGWADTITLPDLEVSASRIVRPPTQQQMQISVIDSRE